MVSTKTVIVLILTVLILGFLAWWFLKGKSKYKHRISGGSERKSDNISGGSGHKSGGSGGGGLFTFL